MDINKIVTAAKELQLERDVSAARVTANAALLSSKRVNKKLDAMFREKLSMTLAKAQGGDPGEVSSLKEQIKSLEARLAKLEEGQTRHTTRLDKHLTRSKAHSARLGHLESQVLEPLAKAAQAEEEKILARGEKRLEAFAFESQRDAILAKAFGVMDSHGIAKIELYLNDGQLEEAKAAVNEAETVAQEIAEIKAEKARRRW